MAKRSQQDVAILAERAYKLLESGMSSSEVARQLQVSPRTLQRWKSRPRLLPLVEGNSQIEVLDSDNFQKHEFREALLSYKPASKLEALIPIALDQLESILTNPETRPSDRLRACQIIGDWSGLNGGADGSCRRVFALGFDIVAPRNPNTDCLYQDAKVGRSVFAETS
jgi:transposase-like protein